MPVIFAMVCVRCGVSKVFVLAIYCHVATYLPVGGGIPLGCLIPSTACLAVMNASLRLFVVVVVWLSRNNSQVWYFFGLLQCIIE